MNSLCGARAVEGCNCRREVKQWERGSRTISLLLICAVIRSGSSRNSEGNMGACALFQGNVAGNIDVGNGKLYVKYAHDFSYVKKELRLEFRNGVVCLNRINARFSLRISCLC